MRRRANSRRVQKDVDTSRIRSRSRRLRERVGHAKDAHEVIANTLAQALGLQKVVVERT